MAHEQDEASGRESVEQFSEGCACGGIEMVCHLVENEEAGLTDERTGDCETLDLAAGEGLSP